MADVTEGIDERLNALAVLVDSGVTLRYGVEAVAEVYRPGLFVGTKEVLDGKPEVPSGLCVTINGEVEDGVIGGAKDPETDAVVCLVPVWIVGTRRHRAINV
jgi:hypothetical protein